jgi:hypothetical protein
MDPGLSTIGALLLLLLLGKQACRMQLAHLRTTALVFR